MRYVFYGRPENWEKYSFSAAIVYHVCPICRAPKEHYCSTSEGRKIFPPHMARSIELSDEEREPTKILCGGPDLNWRFK